MQVGSYTFREVWVLDFEFIAAPGERSIPVCLVAYELISGRVIRLWQGELTRLSSPPFDIGTDSLFVAYYSSAEWGCFLSLGWPLPMNILDLYAEFRVQTNGKSLPCGWSLLGALAYYGLDGIEAQEKTEMRDLILRGGPWTPQERQAILDYCESDVDATTRLLQAMQPLLDMPRALLRGRYMQAVAQIEHNGIPIDTEMLGLLRQHWSEIQDRLIQAVDADYGVYDGRTFKADRFAQYLADRNIPWPRLESGNLKLDDDTFKEMARAYPQLIPLWELRTTLGQMRLTDLAVGSDGRNRCLLSPFRSKTGRNQPSNTRFIFGPATWMRGLIQPPEDHGIAYIDYSQQEFAIAAALSGDPLMKEAYQSGDPYLAFAKQAGAVPPDATKKSHSAQRDQFKACVLAVQYGMGAESLAQRINQPVARARELLALHRETYRVFWAWSESAVNYALLQNELWTTFGWRLHIEGAANVRSLCNWPMQSNGAEMLRLACIFATERGVRVIAPVHDAVLIEAPVDTLDDAVAQTQLAMEEASALVLGGFRLRSDAKIVRYPDRYMDERGQTMWDKVCGLLPR